MSGMVAGIAVVVFIMFTAALFAWAIWWAEKDDDDWPR